MQTFSPDNPIHLRFTFKDESGVGRVTATYRKADGNGVISLQGTGFGEVETTVDLTAVQDRQHIIPGEYHLEALVAADTRGFSRSYRLDDVSEAKRRFQYENDPDADYEGPELVS